MDDHSTGIALGNLGLILVLTLLNATFSMAETALVSVRLSRVEQLIEEGRRGAGLVKRLKDNPPRFIATTQVGITILSFASAAAAATGLERPLIAPIMRLFHVFSIGEKAETTVAVAFVTLLVALFTMILGEIGPKSLAIQTPDVWAIRLAPFINLFASILTPITSFVLAITNLLVRPFGAKAQFETEFIRRDEYEHILSTGEKHGELDEGETTIIKNVFDLSETPVRAVMTARTDMTMLPVDANLTQTLEMILESGHSRIPVYEGTVDNIVGIVLAKDLLPLFRADQHDVDLRSVMREPYFVPRTKSVKDLLEEFRTTKQQLAIVADDGGGTAGLVTIEDLLEEIVGDIRDETDVDEPEIQKIAPGEFLVDGRMSINDVNDQLEIELPIAENDQIGGLLYGLIGHNPAIGDRETIDGVEFIVESLDGRRIKTLRARVHPSSGTEDADEATPAARSARGAPAAGNGKSVEAVEPTVVYDMDEAAV